MKKGIVFAGCSFTYGHGLEYYSSNNEYIDKPEINIVSIQDDVLFKTFPNFNISIFKIIVLLFIILIIRKMFNKINRTLEK